MTFRKPIRNSHPLHAIDLILIGAVRMSPHPDLPARYLALGGGPVGLDPCPFSGTQKKRPFENISPLDYFLKTFIQIYTLYFGIYFHIMNYILNHVVQCTMLYNDKLIYHQP